MTDPHARLAELGLELPAVTPPVAAYIPAVRSGNHVYVSGQVPMADGKLLATGKVAYAYVGVTTQDVTPTLARRYELGALRGALIQTVVEDAPAERAGLRGGSDRQVFNGIPISLGGDLIVVFGGRPVERAADVARIVTDSLLPGDTVSVTVLRGGKGKRETVRLRLVERPLNPTR